MQSKKMTFGKKQVVCQQSWLESLIDNRGASFQIDSSSSLPGPILEQSSPSLSPCHHPVVQCWLGHSIGKRNSPASSLVYCWTTEKWQRKPKKEPKKKERISSASQWWPKRLSFFFFYFWGVNCHVWFFPHFLLRYMTTTGTTTEWDI